MIMVDGGCSDFALLVCSFLLFGSLLGEKSMREETGFCFWAVLLGSNARVDPRLAVHLLVDCGDSIFILHGQCHIINCPNCSSNITVIYTVVIVHIEVLERKNIHSS